MEVSVQTLSCFNEDSTSLDVFDSSALGFGCLCNFGPALVVDHASCLGLVLLDLQEASLLEADL